MGRHSIDEAASLRRVELLEAYVAGLQDKIDALNAKLEQAASVHAEKTASLGPLSDQVDRMIAFVDEHFLGDQVAASDPTQATTEAAPVDQPSAEQVAAAWPGQ